MVTTEKIAEESAVRAAADGPARGASRGAAVRMLATAPLSARSPWRRGAALSCVTKAHSAPDATLKTFGRSARAYGMEKRKIT